MKRRISFDAYYEYCNLINFGMALKQRRSACRVWGVYEMHHIEPISFNANDEDDNKVLLTVKEHIYAHYLLYLIYGGDALKSAYRSLTKNITRITDNIYVRHFCNANIDYISNNKYHIVDEYHHCKHLKDPFVKNIGGRRTNLNTA